MSLDFDRKPSKDQIVYVRFSADELKMIKEVATRYQATKSETVRVLVLRALKSIKAPSTKK